MAMSSQSLAPRSRTVVTPASSVRRGGSFGGGKDTAGGGGGGGGAGAGEPRAAELIEGMNFRGLIPVESEVRVDVNQAGDGGVTAQVNHFRAGRDLRGIGGDVGDPIAADNDNRVLQDLALTVHQLSEVQRFHRGFTGRGGRRPARHKHRAT